MLLNRGRAIELMECFGIDALVATTKHNVLYLSDFIGWAQHSYGNAITETFALFCREENRPPGLIVSRQDETYLACQGTWIEDIRGHGAKGALNVEPGVSPPDEEMRVFLSVSHWDERREPTGGQALGRLLRDRGLERARIGIDQEGLSPRTRALLEDELPGVELLDASGLFRLIRLSKSADEIERLRRAAALNEKAIAAFHAAIGKGRTEREVASHYYRTVGEGGGRWNWLHLPSGHRACAIFPPSERTFAKGDSWMFDAGLVLDGYCADGGGCGFIGEPTEGIQRQWQAVQNGLEAGFSVMRAGVRASEIFEAAVGAVRRSGLPGYNGSFVGHTIGAEPREFPYLLSGPSSIEDPLLPGSTDIPLPAGAVLSFEVPSFVYGSGGCHAEYTVVLTETGFEHLVPTERTLFRT